MTKNLEKVKTPKGVPQDEYILAIALQESESRGLDFCEGAMFDNPNLPTKCCATGALKLAGYVEGDIDTLPPKYCNVWLGNDDRTGDLRGGAGIELGKGYDVGSGFRAFHRPEENELKEAY